MASSDGGSPAVAGGLARHIPVLVPRVVEFLAVRSGRALYRRDLRGGRLQPCHPGGGRREGDRHRPRPDRRCQRRRSGDGGGRPAHPGGGSVLQSRAGGGKLPLDRGRGRGLRPSASPRCSSTRRSGGFSFRLEGPLSMRMGEREGDPSAADVVAMATERELATIIGELGEERHARAVARAIVAERAKAPIRTNRRACRHC